MKDNDQIEKRKTMTAPCDIFEEQGRIVLRIDMPGVEKGNLDVHVENDELRISGKRTNAGTGEGRSLIREIPDRDYLQAYTLDATIDRSRIEAELVKGQLIVKLSIKESEKPRKIEIASRD